MALHTKKTLSFKQISSTQVKTQHEQISKRINSGIWRKKIRWWMPEYNCRIPDHLVGTWKLLTKFAFHFYQGIKWY